MSARGAASQVRPAPAPPRVCLLIERYFPDVGGTEKQGRTLAAELQRRGAGVLVVTRRTRRDMPRADTVDGIPVYRVPIPGRSARLRWVLALTCLPALVAHRREYDVLLVSAFRTLGLPVFLISRLLGKACVLKADSPGEMSGACFRPALAGLRLAWLFPLVRAAFALRNVLIRRAEAFVSMSSELAAEFAACGVPPARIHTIPNSVDTDVFRPVDPAHKAALRARLGLPADGKIVVYAGRLVSYKGLPQLLRTWADLCPRHPRATLLLVGAGSEGAENCEGELRSFVRDRGLEARVRFTGHVNAVETYLQASDAMAFPTAFEAFGLSLIEGMACGLPVVAAAAGGPRDIVTPGRNGLLVPPGDAAALHAALDRILSDDALARDLGAAARATVLERYRADVVAGQYLAIFARATGRGPFTR